MNRHIVVLLLLLMLTTVRGLIYAAVIPPWQSPEEPWHFEVVKVNHENRLTSGVIDRSPELYAQILDSMREYTFWEFVPWADPDPRGGQFHQPPLYYRLASVMLTLMPRGALVEQLFLARLTSVLCSVFIVGIAFGMSGWLFPADEFLRIGVPTFIAYLSTYVFIASTVNNDIAAVVAVTITLFFLLFMLREGLSLIGLVGLVLSLLIGFFAKRTFVIAIPLSLVGIWIVMLLHHVKKPGLRLMLFLAPLFLPAFGLLVVQSGMLGQSIGNSMARFDYAGGSIDVFEMARILSRVYPRYAVGLFKSFWGMFGWGTVQLNPVWYVVCLGISVIAGVGLIRQLLKPGNRIANWQYAVLCMYFLFVLASIALAVVATLDLETDRWPDRFKGASPQARYIFPAIVPIATIFTLGIRGLIPSRYNRVALICYVAVLAGLDAISLWGYIIPFFYGNI